jgi:hypothetical protein
MELLTEKLGSEEGNELRGGGTTKRVGDKVNGFLYRPFGIEAFGVLATVLAMLVLLRVLSAIVDCG